MRCILCSCLLAAFSAVQAQSSFEQEIDNQIWEPFQRAYAEADGELFVSLHAPDVRRVTPWGLQIGAEYLEKSLKGMSKPDWPTNKISFRFEHRLHRAELAYEVGYYQIIYDESGEEAYGRFHVVLEKMDGKWKIIQDWDTNQVNGEKVNAQDFYRLPE
jgi:ketosteroid isomerase-like protein